VSLNNKKRVKQLTVARVALSKNNDRALQDPRIHRDQGISTCTSESLLGAGHVRACN
jgi:hypothetical protein